MALVSFFLDSPVRCSFYLLYSVLEVSPWYQDWSCPPSSQVRQEQEYTCPPFATFLHESFFVVPLLQGLHLVAGVYLSWLTGVQQRAHTHIRHLYSAPLTRPPELVFFFPLFSLVILLLSLFSISDSPFTYSFYSFTFLLPTK